MLEEFIVISLTGLLFCMVVGRAGARWLWPHGYTWWCGVFFRLGEVDPIPWCNMPVLFLDWLTYAGFLWLMNPLFYEVTHIRYGIPKVVYEPAMIGFRIKSVEYEYTEYLPIVAPKPPAPIKAE